MRITKENLSEVMFENENARLLIKYVVTHTNVNLYYYHGYEITVQSTIYIWNRAMKPKKKNMLLAYHV